MPCTLRRLPQSDIVLATLDYFAAIPGCWPSRALPTSGCPQTGRPQTHPHQINMELLTSS